MRALDLLPTPADFNLLPLEMAMADLDALRTAWQFESLSMMINYKMNWNEWYAIREFVQNALDATDSVTLLDEDTQKIAYIVDNGSGIMLRHMFLGEQKGETDQEIHCLRGRFGEGMKLSLLPLMRAGNRVIIRTVGTDYHFAIVERTDAKGTFQQIYMFNRPNVVTQGTAVAIENISCLKYRTYFAPMIAEDSPEKVLISVKGGPNDFDDCKVRQAFDLPGKIFVRDIYVTTYDAVFGYNFWFNDTRRVLSSDRNELKDASYNIRLEFEYFLKANCAPFLTKLLHTLYRSDTFYNSHTKQEFGKKQSLEWYALNEYNYLDEITFEDATTLFEIILLVIGGKEFSWSRNTAEQKILEHARITDLRDTLPDLRNILVKFKFVKDPKDIARAAELSNETVVISAEDFKVSELEGAEELVDALSLLKEQLDFYLMELRRYVDAFNNVKIVFYAGNFKGTEQSVLGYFEQQTRTVYIHTRNLEKPSNLLRVFIHEMAHAYCEGCHDVTQEFEDALQNIAVEVIEMIRTGGRSGDCNVDRLHDYCKTIDRYRDTFNQVIQEKVAIVSNPLNLVRPEHTTPKDRDLLDEAFFKIAKGAYGDFEDVLPVLWGYNPNGYRYTLGWPSRGTTLKNQKMTLEQIRKEDLQILRKLKFDLPVDVENFSNDDWIKLIEDATREDRVEKFKLPGEDWTNPNTCISFVMNHPRRWVKARNFNTFYSIINPYPAMSADWEKTREEWGKGLFADPVELEKFHKLAPAILKLEHPAFKITGYDPYAICLKEKVIERSRDLGWIDVLIVGLSLPDPTNRRYAVYGLGKNNVLEPIIELLRHEKHPEVIVAILNVLRKRDRDLFYQILDSRLSYFKELARTDESDQLSYYRKELGNFIEHSINAREMFKKWGHWPSHFDSD